MLALLFCIADPNRLSCLATVEPPAAAAVGAAVEADVGDAAAAAAADVEAAFNCPTVAVAVGVVFGVPRAEGPAADSSGVDGGGGFTGAELAFLSTPPPPAAAEFAADDIDEANALLCACPPAAPGDRGVVVFVASALAAVAAAVAAAVDAAVDAGVVSLGPVTSMIITSSDFEFVAALAAAAAAAEAAAEVVAVAVLAAAGEAADVVEKGPEGV